MKKKFVLAGVFLLLFLLLIVAVKVVDVAPVGPLDTSIGLSSINSATHEFLGVNMLWYDLTEAFGILAIAVAAAFAVIGLIQLIKRKNILKVDAQILALGCLYVCMAAVYVLFEVVVVNYRCILMPDSSLPEASFPSSHTMLVCVVIGSAVAVACSYVKRHGIRLAIHITGAVIIVVTSVGRLLSGVHWLTDIIGGALISTALVIAFVALADLLESKLLKNNSIK